jgi:hypothetical protein
LDRRASEGRISPNIYRTGDEAPIDALDYIEHFDNPYCRHSTLGHVSQIAFEARMRVAKLVVRGTRMVQYRYRLRPLSVASAN